MSTQPDHRAELLAAFASLDEDSRAELLELAETWAFRATAAANTASSKARDIFRQAYVKREPHAFVKGHAAGLAAEVHSALQEHYEGTEYAVGTGDGLGTGGRYVIPVTDNGNGFDFEVEVRPRGDWYA